MPEFTADASASCKLTPQIDTFFNYSFTYDKLDTYGKNDTLINHIFAPGLTYYFTTLNFFKVQPVLSTDFNDYNFLISMSQNFAFNSYNLMALSVYYGKGKRIMEFPGETVNQDLKSYGLSAA